jgi:uncharacterized alpha/beta hydrolase family protein
MKKQILIIGIIVLPIAVGLSGCTDNNQTNNENNNQTKGNEDNLKPEIQIIAISGIGVVQTINNINNPIKLIVSGVNCNITVTQDTNLTEVIMSGVNSTVGVSHIHSFTSTVSGVGSKIVYYD